MDNSKNSNSSDTPGSSLPSSTSDLWPNQQSTLPTDVSADSNLTQSQPNHASLPWETTAPQDPLSATIPSTSLPSDPTVPMDNNLDPLNPQPFPASESNSGQNADPWPTPASPQQDVFSDPLSTYNASSSTLTDPQTGSDPISDPTSLPQTNPVTNSPSNSADLSSLNQVAAEPTINAIPTPTFTPPLPSSQPTQNGQNIIAQNGDNQETILSPLDNPLGAPLQIPPLEQPQPASQPSMPAQPSWSGFPTGVPSTTPQNSPITESANRDNMTPIAPAEAAPTDLSHLLSNNQAEPSGSSSETLFVPSGAPQAPEVPNLQTESHKSIPKWLFVVGAFLLIAVIGTSAYFILGVGNKNETTSLPATTTSETNQPKQSVASPPPAESGTGEEINTSDNFGQLQGSGSQNDQPATSAAEILRQRQQQQAQTP